MFVLLALLGAFYWTLLEYLLHRFAFHGHPKLLGRRHFKHHADMTVRTWTIAPPRSFLGGAALHGVVFWLALGAGHGLALFSGFLVGYLAYEVVHYRIHFAEPRTAWGRALREHHMLHHDVNPFSRYGVSTAFWDRVFGTLEPRRTQRRRPRR